MKLATVYGPEDCSICDQVCSELERQGYAIKKVLPPQFTEDALEQVIKQGKCYPAIMIETWVRPMTIMSGGVNANL